MPVIATSRKATTAMILERIEYLASMGTSWFWARRVARRMKQGGEKKESRLEVIKTRALQVVLKWLPVGLRRASRTHQRTNV